MLYRYCGHSGLQLPVVSLGLWHNFSDYDSYVNMRSIIHDAFDKGITHFDLANNYGPEPGSAERNFGKILADGLAAHRDEMIITSKAGHLMWDGPYGDGSSRKYLMASINQSLKRTGLEYFDIFYSHRYCADTPLEETVQALIDIVRQGKALYVGLSKYPPELAARACKMMEEQHVHCLVYQDRYSMLSRTPENGNFDVCRQEGMGFVAFSPLAQGLLTDRYLNGIPADSRVNRVGGFLQRHEVTPEIVEKVSRLNEVAKGRGQSMAQMALAWVLAHDVVTSVIVGASSVSQLDDNIATIDRLDFSPEELAEIDRILL